MAFVAVAAKRSSLVRGLKRPSTPYLLLIPGLAWLLLFLLFLSLLWQVQVRKHQQVATR